MASDRARDLIPAEGVTRTTMQQLSLTLEPADREQEPDHLSQAVVESVAEAEGVDPTELTPLYAVVDPDALEALFRPNSPTRDRQIRGEIRFSYHGYDVRVTADGEVDVADGTER